MLFDEIRNQNRMIDFQYRRLLAQGNHDPDLDELARGFLEAYAAYYSLTVADVVSGNVKFIDRYTQDLAHYKRTGEYPFEYRGVDELERVHYDIPLILSVLTSPVRHELMKFVRSAALMIGGDTALVGIGPGLELEIIRHYGPRDVLVEAYDTSMSDFAKSRFQDVRLFETSFSGRSTKASDMFLVELLEHLSQPLELIEACSKSLTTGGIMYLTTATAMPQFDHVYKFDDDHDFERNVTNLGFSLESKEVLNHNYVGGPENARNTWYCFLRGNFSVEQTVENVLRRQHVSSHKKRQLSEPESS